MRKLAIAATSFSMAIFAANYIFDRAYLLYVSALLVLFALALVFMRRKWLRGFEIAFISAALGFCVFYVHGLYTSVPAAELSGQELDAQAVILDYPRVYEDYCSVEIRLSEEKLPKLKAIIYDNDMCLAEARPGQKISFTASFKAADSRYGEEYDYYYSKGIYLILSSRSSIKIIGSSPSVFYIWPEARHYIAGLTDSLFPDDTSAFMRSVMLGDKSGLYDDAALYTCLSRAGFMHIAAVSGMHLSFLAGMILLIAGRGRLGSLIAIFAMWFFALMTGASPSAVRAAFMQTLLLMAPVFRRENDPVTSLATVLALVLFVNPYSAASISLQLSFSAMAGLLCITEKINHALLIPVRKTRLKKILRYPIGIAAASLSVMVFTVPLMAVHFSSVSVLAPLGNILALWAVSICFCGGLISCFLGAVLPWVGAGCACLISWFARYIIFVARLISSLKIAVVYLDNPFMWCWFCLCLAVLVSAFFIKRKLVFKISYVLAMAVLFLVQANVLADWYYASGGGTLAVLDVGQGQSIAAISKDSAVVVDCGGNGSIERAGEITGRYLISRGVDEIDVLLISHLHSDHANGVLMLMELLDVKNIYLPENPADDEGLLPSILESAERHGSAVHYVSADLDLELDGISLTMYKPGEKGSANERCVMSCLSAGEYDMLITADADMSAENELVHNHDLSGIDAFVVGHHGSRYSSGQALLSSLGAELAVISSGYNNYGHPTWETLERLRAYGFEIYRTDLNGTVEIRP